MANLTLMMAANGGQRKTIYLAQDHTVTAQPGMIYTIIDQDSQQVPTNLLLKRTGDDLEIAVEGEVVAHIVNFYGEEMTASFSADGTLAHSPAQNMAKTSATSSNEGARPNDGSDWTVAWSVESEQASEFSAYHWLLGAGGIAAVALSLGGGGDSEPEPPIEQPSYTITVNAVAGQLTSIVTVELYTETGNLIPNQNQTHDFSTGPFSYEVIGGYQGPILVRIIDDNETTDYLDEATNTMVNLGGPLHALFSADGVNDISVSVTPLTELAFRKANINENTPTDDGVLVNNLIGSLFGLDDILGPVTTVLDDGYNSEDGVDQSEFYGNILAALSGSDSTTGGLSATIDLLEQSVVQLADGRYAFSQATIELLQQGIAVFENGENADQAELDTSLINTPVIAAGGASINIAEAQEGVVIALQDVAAGDVVVVKWGDQSFTVTVDLNNIDGVTVPSEIVDAAGAGAVLVSTEVNDDDTGPAVVIDVDLSVPQFISVPTIMPINENTPAGQVVYTAVATDNAAVSYGLKAALDADAFTVDSTTGAVMLIDSPDHEAQDSYSFTVVATDAAGNASEQTLDFTIIDLDEIPPTITSATTAAAIAENSSSGQIIYIATSIDNADVGDGVTYSLKAGDAADFFSIGSITGGVTLIESPDYEAQSSYSFTFIATDVAGNSSEQTVSLNVNNLDEVAPVITSGANATALDENTKAGQVIYTVTSDDTADISGGVSYSLIAGADAGSFTINGATGAVRLTEIPDHETKASYSFSVAATDAVGNSSTQLVNLSVNDLDEIAPTITSATTAATIDENSGPGQVIYTVTSTDTADISDGVSYSLKSGADSAAFTIDAVSGEVTLNANPDYESQDNYSFIVVATDAAGNAREQTVGLSINDLDEVAPTITSATSATAINENSSAGQIIYVAAATDNEDADVSYSLKVGLDAALFTIDTATGAVTLTESPDHETKANYSFTFVATDTSGNASERTVSLNINDLDEVAPTITSGNSATTINENSGAGQEIYTVTATDNGDISNGVSYSLKAVGDAAAFSIHNTTGEVTLIANPNHEAKSGYNFTVVATDAAGHASEQAVSLSINDLDEVAPTITSGGSATTINENSGAGQVIYTVTATDDADVSGGVSYSLKATGDASALTIDSVSGAVTLIANPDHESKSSYNFTVVATDAAGNASEKAVGLSVNDLDEVAPSITSGANATAINENSGAGQVIYTVVATDTADVGGSIGYSLKVGADAADFAINGTSGEVTLTADPDHETKPSYNFTVIATDTAGNFSEQAVSLNINDLDEVAPTITSGANATAIDENSGSGQVIYTVTATDTGDVSDGVSFSLKAGGDASAFSINSTTGKVTLIANPNHEAKASYSFTVLATDAAGNASEKTVGLSINDRDEVAPAITSGSSAAAIDENSGAGQLIYTVTATDDADVSGGISYSLKPGTDAADFTISSSTGEVVLTANPDHETKASYNFTVVATDAAGNASEKAVSLNINDIDEVAPTITSGGNATAINENSGAGQVIYTVTATDTADVGGGVSYSLKFSADSAEFLIDSTSGEVTLLANPNHETQSDYNFIVVATDAADNFSEKAVNLSINDLDEVAPTITSGLNATALNENSGAGQTIYTVTSDDSGDISNGVSYSLKTGGDAADFSVNSTSGAVTLIANPDHEAKASYSFTVVATDAAGNASEQTVGLAINDLDDSVPVITSSASATAINENSGAGKVIYTATATDTADVDDPTDTSSQLSYSLKGTNDYGHFSIDATSGAVTLTADPDFETKPNYNFTVQATDTAGNVAEQGVTLAINNLDDTAPVIDSPSSATAVDENSGAGQVIYTVISDDSADVSDGVSYSLKAVADVAAFSINSTSGEVTLTANPDHEAKASYNFTVVATDVAGNASEKAVSLSIKDLDEIAPTITSGANAAAIDENSGAGQVVYTVTSTDSADISDGVSYSLKAVADAAAFNINDSTGAVTLTANPDHETKASYNFTVVATDMAGNASEQAVTLAINDLDDTAPIITSGAIAPAIDENSGAGQVIYTVTSDDSADVSDGVSYSLKAGGDAAAFSINSSTGAVTLIADPDFETKASYNFTVEAFDVAGNGSEKAVSLNINDIAEGMSGPMASPSSNDGAELDSGEQSTQIVVFDLTANTSTDDGAREFQDNVSYDIRIIVDSDSETFNWGAANQWTKASNLGADDIIRLVGDDASGILGSNGNEINAINAISVGAAASAGNNHWQAAGAVDPVILTSAGLIKKQTSGSYNTITAALWTNSGNYQTNPNVGVAFSQLYYRTTGLI